MDKDKGKLVLSSTECAPGLVSDKSQSLGTRPGEAVYNTANKSLPIFILTPVNTNAVKSQFVSPNILCNTSNELTHVLTPCHIQNNSASAQSVPCVSLVPDTGLKSTVVQQKIANTSQELDLKIVTALLQNITSPIPLENTEPEYGEIQKTIDGISRDVERIFATSSEGILITFPCTPGFEKEKVGPADRIIVKCGSSSSFGLCDECELEKKFNIIFHYMSADVPNLSTESAIKQVIYCAMNTLMDVMPVEYALTLVCSCSLCWFLYMCAKVAYRDSPEGLPKLNWSGCPISSYRCLAMRRIVITDVKSEGGVCEDSSVHCRSTLQIRFTRSGQKRRQCKQSEQIKIVKRRMVSLVPDLDKASKVIARTSDNADVTQKMASSGSGFNKAPKITVRMGDNADVPSCSFNNMKPGRSKKDAGRKVRGFPGFRRPEDDIFVFNPVQQFRGNTYARDSDTK